MVGGWTYKKQLVHCFPQAHPDYCNQPTITPPVVYTQVVSAYFTEATDRDGTDVNDGT